MLKDLIEEINEILPQTQCTRCGYPNCNEYATAVAQNTADINQCPPGGDLVIKQLATLLNKSVKALNPENGSIKPRQIAIIKEEDCIGCTLCIKACPVDAIVGANKMMHTVIEDYCTGCDLCLPACPVDCIIMVDAVDDNWSKAQAQAAKQRFDNRNLRKQIELKEREARLKRIRENKN
ncbi:MAG: hypothetical protein RL017_115 [Pseudomonadota bacterium]|jgi:electron transport complex protein RnfB|nr:RnfABCDGE type electron transport complex subunit B [Burkholderiales bacterium]